MFPLRIRAGIDLVGPGMYIDNRNNLTAEGFVSYDRNESMSYVLEGGYLKYKYSQYNYDYQANGIFLRAGVDFDLLKPLVSKGKHWAGVGLRYGAGFYRSSYPSLVSDNYWGSASSAIPSRNAVAHFLEFAPGVRSELFRNVSIGWTIRLNLLLSAGTGKNVRPVYIPGFGNGGKSTSAGINYYIVWSIPYKTKRVIIKKEVPQEEEETEQESPSTTQPVTTGRP